jgi:iron complex outermembrane receptor protein
VLYSTWLENALIVDADSLARDVISIRNVTGLTWTRGGELTSQFSIGDFKLSISYAYLDTRQTDKGITEELELNPHHWLGVILMYENKEAGIKAGLENYYTSPQHLYDNPFRTMSPDFSLTGFVIEKAFGNFRLFLNAEDIFDTRQTRFDPTFTGDPANGDFHPLHIYAPLEGRAFNGGIRFVL